MTTRWMRLYYFALFGAIGGLIAWQLSNLLGLSFTPSVYLSEIIVGGLMGLAIGLLLGLAEGLLTRNFIHALRTGLFGGLLGLVGGAIGLPMGELLFQTYGAQTWARPAGWAIFGFLTGFAVGLKGGIQAWKSALGGFLGGLMGGYILEFAMQKIKNSLLGKAIGLILLGASMGVFIALIAYALSRVWLEVKTGKLKGTEFILDKFLKKGISNPIIGNSPLKADIVIPDPMISPQHAMLTGEGDHFNLKDMSLEGTYVNDKKIEQVRLKDHQTIRMGKTVMVYREKR
jgi:hypothetical protein